MVFLPFRFFCESSEHFPANKARGGGGVGGNWAYSRLSTTHGHITNCKLDWVVYAGVCVEAKEG